MKKIYYLLFLFSNLAYASSSINLIPGISPDENPEFKALKKQAFEIAKTDDENTSAITQLGEGGNGYVLPVGDKFALKVMVLNHSEGPSKAAFLNEVRALHELRELDQVVTMHAAWTAEGRWKQEDGTEIKATKGFILMDKLQEGTPDGMSLKEEYKQVRSALQAARAQGWLQVDCDPDNVMHNGKHLILIDFGCGVKAGEPLQPFQLINIYGCATFEEFEKLQEKELRDNYPCEFEQSSRSRERSRSRDADVSDEAKDCPFCKLIRHCPDHPENKRL